MSEPEQEKTPPRAIDSMDLIAERRVRIMLPVSFVVWDRLKGRVEKLGNMRLDYTNYVMGAWGICIPCVISFAVYLPDTNRPHWALPVYGIVAGASGATAKVLSRFQKSEAEIRKVDATDIVAEMRSVEEAYERGGVAT